MADRQQDEMSRAEKVRARRQTNRKEAPKAPVRSNVTRKPKPSNVPITRRPVTAVPVVTRKKHAVNVPLKQKGAELQIPAFPQLQLGWRLISGAIFFLSFAVVFSFSSLSTFQVNAITLRGAQRLSAEAVLNQIDIVGTSIIQLDPERIKTSIEERFPGLKSVNVSVSLPASVTVHVQERQPTILWQQDNTAFWIDSEGVMFPVIGEAEVAQDVIASGVPPSPPEVFVPELDDLTGEISHRFEENLPRTTPAFVQAVLSLSGYIPEGTTLAYDPQFGLGWQDPNGWLVYFGQDTNHMETKLAQYQVILEKLQKQSVSPSLISLEFLHAPYYRLEQ
jgi:cell division protein FtsQ